jgi:hypothetical protein
MASRHVNYLRKHQKVILAILCVVCMITFVVGPFLMDLIGSAGGGGGPGENPVVVTWVGGKVRQSELQLKQQTHQVAVNFLRMLILQSVQRGGQPVVNGQAVTKEMGPPEDPGIPGDSSEPTIVRTMLLAKKADEMGIVVDREAARDFVLALSFPDVTEAEWPAILAKAAPDNMPMSVDQLLDQLAFDLKATHARVLSQAGLFGLPPGQVWEYHNRLNRRFAIEAYPVEVAPFAGQVQEEPKREELLALFEKGRRMTPIRRWPTPASTCRTSWHSSG